MPTGIYKRKPMGEEQKKKIGLANRGKKRSLEIRRAISERQRGKKRQPTSNETKEKIRQKTLIQFKNGMPEKTRQKLSKALTGKKHSKETIKKRSDSLLIHWKDNKNSEINIGRLKSLRDIQALKKGKTYEEIYGAEKALQLKKILTKTHIGKCMGEDNPNWQGGISFEPYSVDWVDTLKRSIRERYKYICQICNSYGNNIHHVDYNKKNCNPSNLICLCRSCHCKTNFDREKWTKYFMNKLKWYRFIEVQTLPEGEELKEQPVE